MFVFLWYFVVEDFYRSFRRRVGFFDGDFDVRARVMYDVCVFLIVDGNLL